MSKTRLCCAIFLAHLLKFTGSVVFSDIHWTTAIRLSEYEGYRSVSLLSYDVPPQATKVTFSFQAKTSGSSCHFKEVYVYFQHGSYPLVTPYNETFPSNFYTNRTGAYHVKIQKDAEAISYVLGTPRPGTWYFAAFLPKPSTDKIQQKGLDKSCMYGMVVVVESQGLDNVQAIPIEKSNHVHLTQETYGVQALYRYMLPVDAVEYALTIDNCVVKHLEHTPEKSPQSDSNVVDHLLSNSSKINSTDIPAAVNISTHDNRSDSVFTFAKDSSTPMKTLAGDQSSVLLSSTSSSVEIGKGASSSSSLKVIKSSLQNESELQMDSTTTSMNNLDVNSSEPITTVAATTRVTPSTTKISTTASTTTTTTTASLSNQTDSQNTNETTSPATEFSTTSTQAPTPTSPPSGIVSNICPVKVFLDSARLPSEGSTATVICGNATSCKKIVKSPKTDDWSYIVVEIDNKYNVSEIDFDLKIQTKECESFKFLLPKTILNRVQHDTKVIHAGPHQDSCVKFNSLGRFVWGEQTFNVTYVFSNQGAIPIPEPLRDIPVEDRLVIVTNFIVDSKTDIGGTLWLQATLNLKSFDTKSQTVFIYLCMMRGAVPGGQTVRSCKDGILVTMATNETSAQVHVPYPEPGTWNLGLNSKCFDKITGLEAQCTSIAHVDLVLGISGCLSGQCGEYGECVDYISGVHIFSSCKCYAGWRGYGCTDGTEARSRGEELTAVLLLTLSNLFFIPSAILAIYRRYYVEAAIYTYTMFLSAFYHACDTSNLVNYCALRYDILSFGDFLGSISSFWVTMLVMAKIPGRMRGFAQTIGVVGISVGVEYDRHGLLVFAIPAGIAGVIMFGSWIFQCRQKRKLYPTKRYLLIHLLPGVVLASVGLVLFAFLETDENYKYTHSVWHVAMSLSIVFLLPPRQQKGKIGTDGSTVAYDHATTTNTGANTSSRIVLTSYMGNSSGDTNGHVVNHLTLESGDNPAYISQD